MNDFLTDFRPEALVPAIEANLCAVWRTMSCSPGVEIQEDDRGLRIASGIPHPVCNAILRTRLADAEVEAAIAESVAHFRSRGLPFSWFISPSTRPADLGRHLEAHGLGATEGLIGMAVDLHRLEETGPAPMQLTVERVGDAETLREWSRTAIAAFEMPEFMVEPWADMTAAVGLGPEAPLQSYLARLRGEPVATSQCFLAEGVAGIYTVGTLATARRQGIGAALTRTALRTAREAGCRAGILHATEMGAGVYRRIGFREYCRLPLYVWEGETADG
jgi:GNAT superfamily N-acetyltransferase